MERMSPEWKFSATLRALNSFAAGFHDGSNAGRWQME
jgi:hypothetical protein